MPDVAYEHVGGVAYDFALVSVPNAYSNPDWIDGAIAALGGPCGQYSGNEIGKQLRHVGYGVDANGDPTPRLGVASSWSTSITEWVGAARIGDSGSPVRTDDGFGSGIAARVDPASANVVVGYRVSGPRLTFILTAINLGQAVPWTLLEDCPAP